MVVEFDEMEVNEDIILADLMTTLDEEQKSNHKDEKVATQS